MAHFIEGVARLIKLVFGLAIIAVFLLVLGTSLVYYQFSQDLPKLERVEDYRPQLVTQVFDKAGTKIGEFWQENRYVLPYDQIPKRVVDAFIASEDERFWDHKGLYFRGITRATVENIIAGKVVQGASTITQQITRSLLLTREKSYERKIKAAILATAYAPAKPDYARKSPFETLLEGDQSKDGGRFIPPLAKGDHNWMSKPLPESVFGAAEQKCLANAIYFEARSESLRGQAAVAQVVLNRVRNPTYPNSICGVVYQNDSWKNRCQFSFACDGKADRIASPKHYKVAQEIAMAVTAGKIFLPEIGSSTHYYASYVSPRWANSMQKMKKIGLHIFYRTYGGGWS